MGKKNVQTKAYISQNDRFADLCNYLLFDGEMVIKPEDLEEKDVTELALPYSDKETIAVEKIRDVLKGCIVKMAEDTTYLVVGVENQSDIHYAMVVRNMLYDALNYASQVNNKAKKHKKEKNLKDAEFLSGFARADKIRPVVTITVYWNAGGWNGPRSLYDMLDVKHPKVLQYISNYKLNLVVPDEMNDFDKFRTELGIVMEFLKCSAEGKKLKKLLDEKKKEGMYITRDAVELLNSCVNAGLLLSGNEEEGAEMCKAIQELVEEGRNEGISRGYDQLNRLNQCLAKENRIEDLIRAASDQEYQKKLLEEYGI